MAISTRSFVVALCSSVFAAGLVASAGQTPPLGALVVPEGFHADVFADNVENAREMTLGPQGRRHRDA